MVCCQGLSVLLAEYSRLWLGEILVSIGEELTKCEVRVQQLLLLVLLALGLENSRLSLSMRTMKMSAAS